MKTEEIPILTKLTKDVAKLTKEVEVFAHDTQQEQYVQKLEDLCFSLKCAFVEFTLKMPSLTTFERYLCKLDSSDDIIYLIGLLHQCWLYTHPFYLFDKNIKDEDPVVALKKSLSHKANSDYDLIEKELNRDNITELTIIHYKAYNDLEPKMQDAYQKYVEGLWNICDAVCKKKDIQLCPEFVINYSLNSALSPTQIEQVFQAVADTGRMINNVETAATFRALFSSTISAVEHKILWLDINEKNERSVYVSLRVMFEAMGVKMNRTNLRIICNAFETHQGEITEDQLKSTQYRMSGKLKELQDIVRQAL